MNERVKLIRKQLGMTQEQLAQRLGIGKAALSMIETGKAGLSARNRNILVQELNVNPEWLESGKGNMFNAEPDLTAYMHRTDNSLPLQSVPLYSIEGTAGLVLGIASVVGNNAVSVVIVSDFTRYSKTRKDAIRGCILGYFFGYVPILLMGAIFTYSFNNWNIVEVMLGELNLGIVAAIVLILAQWTTNDNNLYSSVLGVANVLAGTRIKYKRWLLTLIVGIISIAFSAIGLVDHYLSFLSILTATIPAMAGVVISDFFFLNKNGYEFELIEKKKLADWNWSGIISWFLAIFMGLCMTAAPTGLGVPALVKLAGVVPTPIVGVIVAFVCNMVLYPLLNKRAAKG